MENNSGVLVGPFYKLGERIGSGSFGQIYYGTNTNTGEEVAIKLVRALPFLHYINYK